MTARLSVHLDGRPVGTLDQTSGGTRMFTYHAEYREARDATPLSLSLPLALGRQRSRSVDAYLWGLLPDNENTLRRWAARYGVSHRNPMALLRHVGMDAAGAVQILPPDESSSDAATRYGDITWHDDDELRDLLANLARSRDWDSHHDAGRWSLAGAQNKVAMFRSQDGRWGTPRDATPTTHILKPSITGYGRHHLNEHLCLHAARILGLNACVTELFSDDSVEVVVSHRYDRQLADGRWRRLHQEDLCQALSVVPEKKYQSDGGPGVSDIALLFGRLPARSRRSCSRDFFVALAYNVLIHATDAHAKNYSLMLDGRDVVNLAPLYDVATILPYASNAASHRSAMKIGDTWIMDAATPKDWAQVAARLRLNADEAVATVEKLRSGIPDAFHAAASDDGIPTHLRDDAQRIAGLVSDAVMASRPRT